MAVMICPYLGIEEDRETAVAFPSPRNRCFRTGNASLVSTVQQDDFCLRDTHEQCPVYLLRQQLNNPPQPPAKKPGLPAVLPTLRAPHASQGKPPTSSPPKPVGTAASARPASPKIKPAAPVPQATQRTPAPNPGRLPASPSKTRRVKDTVLTGLMGGGIMAILLAAILILPAYGSQIFGGGTGALSIPPTITAEQRSGVIRQPSEVYIVPSGTPTATARPTYTTSPTATSTKKPTVRPSRTATRRLTATELNPAPPTITLRAPNCGVPYGWVLYTIQHGDTLTSLSQRTSTSVYQLQTANCMGTSTLLYAGMSFYLPFIPAPVNPTQPWPSNTAVPTITRSPVPLPTQAPSSTPIPVQPSATPKPPTVEPSPVQTLAPEVTPDPGEVSPTAIPTGAGG